MSPKTSKTFPKGWRTIRTIAIARAISILGDEFAIFALLLRVKHDGGHAMAIALVLAVGQVPLIIFSPWAGAIVDRVPVRRLAPLVCLVQSVFAGLLAFDSPLYIELALLFLIGVGQAFTAPAWTATLPEITDKDSIPRAMSLMQAMYAIAGMAGPAIAGILVARFGYVTPMVSNAITFLILAAVPLFLTLPATARNMAPKEKGEIWVGLDIVRKEPVIRSLTILGFSLNMIVGLFSVAELFFVLDDLHSTYYIYGITGSIFAGSMLLSAVLNERRSVSQEKLPVNVIIGAGLAGLGVFLNGSSWNWEVLLPTLAVIGIGVTLLNVYFIALVLQRAPEVSRGRVMSAITAVTSIGQISSLGIGGIIVTIFDARAVILVSGLVCMAVAILSWPSLQRAISRSRVYNDGKMTVTDSPEAE